MSQFAYTLFGRIQYNTTKILAIRFDNKKLNVEGKLEQGIFPLIKLVFH